MKRLLVAIIAGIFISLSAVAIVHAAGDIAVQLQIPIPGLGQSLPVCATRGDELQCTGIAQYIAFMYRWLVGIAAVLAVLALTWGGVRWLTSAGESGAIQDAKKIMGNAIVGLAIAFCSYALLWAINPELVQFNPLRIRPISEIALEIKEIKATIFSSGGGTNRVASMSANLTTWDSKLAAASAARGVDCTLLKAIMIQESGGNPNAISPKGAVGLMQVMPGEIYPGRPSRSELLDPDKNIDWAANHVNLLVNTACNGGTSGSGCDIIPLGGLLATVDANRLQTDAAYKRALEFIAAAYNAGPGRNKLTVEPSCKGKLQWECPKHKGLYEETFPFTQAIVENFTQLKNKNWGCDAASPGGTPPIVSAPDDGERGKPSPTDFMAENIPEDCDEGAFLNVPFATPVYAAAAVCIRTKGALQKIGLPPAVKFVYPKDTKARWDFKEGGVGAGIIRAAQALEKRARANNKPIYDFEGLIGMWASHEMGFNPYGSACGTEDSIPLNRDCNWGDGGNYHVGLGVHTRQIVYLKEAFQNVYGSSDVDVVRTIAQGVIDRSGKSGHATLTIVSKRDFDAVRSLDDLIASANRGDLKSRREIVTLMRDPAIGSYLIGRHLTSDMDTTRLGTIMLGWGSSYGKQDMADLYAGYYKFKQMVEAQ